MISINEISEVLKGTRESSGISLDEVAKDLKIEKIKLVQIEDGNTGSFKDIFELKKYLKEYAKYLGLNSDEVIDEFNEYMFERTSKLPMNEIKKAVKETSIEESKDNRIASPYTRLAPIQSNKQFILTLIVVFILVILAIYWSVKQVTMGISTI